MGLRAAVVLHELAIVVGRLLFLRVVAEVRTLLGLVTFVALLVPLTRFLAVAGSAMGGSVAAAERLALVVLVIFRWTSLSTSATILCG